MKKVYILKYDSYIVLNNKIKELTEGIEDIVNYSFNDTSIDELIESSSYVGFLDDKKCLIIKDFAYFGDRFKHEEESEQITKWLANIDESIVIIFPVTTYDSRKEFTKNVIGLGVTYQDLTHISDEEKKSIVDSYCASNGIILEQRAYEELNRNTKGYIDITMEELKKISLVEKKITESTVKEYGSRYLLETDTGKVDYNDISWKFYNAVTAKNFKDMFNLLDELLDRGDEPALLLNGLFTSFLPIYIVKEAESSGATKDEIIKKTGYSEKRIPVLEKSGKIYTLEDLKNILLKIAEMDTKSKQGYDLVYMLKQFLIEL